MEQTLGLRQAVRDYRAGRQEAFTQLYEESGRYLYTCVCRVMSGNDNMQDAVGDIMQDTYVEISRNIAQLASEDSFLSWAGTIATRKCYEWLKKNRRYVLLNEDDTTFEDLADDDGIIPEEVMQSREKQRLVRQIIDTQLTPVQKICIVSYYFNERKQSEIARELGIPENTVKTNLSRAKAKIRDGVLDLERRQGTKLYSLAPLLLLLFREDAAACVLPGYVTARVTAGVSAHAAAGASANVGSLAGGSVNAGASANAGGLAGGALQSAAGAGGKSILGKLALASLKVKIAVALAGLGVAGALAGGAVYVAGADERNAWPAESGYEEEEDEAEEMSDEGDGDAAQDAEPPQEASVPELPAQEEPAAVEVSLSGQEREDLAVLISMMTAKSHFWGGGNMDGGSYPVGDVAADMDFIDIIGMRVVTVGDQMEYLPPTEIEDNYNRYCSKEDVKLYLKNVFGIENADLSAYGEGDRVLFDTFGEPAWTDTSMDSEEVMPGGIYKITGVVEISEGVHTFYPYEFTAVRNEESPFRFRVLSMAFGESRVVEY